MNLGIWSREDLITYFQSTYVGIQEEDGIKALKINDVVDLTDQKVKAFCGVVGRHSIAIPINSESLKIVVPESTFVNCCKQTVYCSRRTERQYKKGIREGQFRVNVVSAGDVLNEGDGNLLQYPNFSRNIVGGLVNPDFPIFEDALEELYKGKSISCAFDKHFAVAVKPDIEDVVLLYKGMICGKVLFGGKIELLDECTQLREKLIEIIGG